MTYVIFDDCVTLLPTLNIKILFSAILSVISDNAANMVCLVRLLNVLLKADIEQWQQWWPRDLLGWRWVPSPNCQTHESRPWHNLWTLCCSWASTKHQEGVRCLWSHWSSHQSKNYSNVLRTQSIAALLRKNHQKKVISDNNTRWSKLVRTKYYWFVC